MFKRLFLTRNIATWDRVVRVFPALISILAFMQGWISGGLALVMATVRTLSSHHRQVAGPWWCKSYCG